MGLLSSGLGLMAGANPWVIGGMAGLSMLQARQQRNQASGQNKVRAAEQQYADVLGPAQTPWAQKQGYTGAGAQGALGGAMLVQNMQNAQMQGDMLAAKTAELNAKAKSYGQGSGIDMGVPSSKNFQPLQRSKWMEQGQQPNMPGMSSPSLLHNIIGTRNPNMSYQR